MDRTRMDKAANDSGRLPRERMMWISDNNFEGLFLGIMS
jgi:hypothetical protein